MKTRDTQSLWKVSPPRLLILARGYKQNKHDGVQNVEYFTSKCLSIFLRLCTNFKMVSFQSLQNSSVCSSKIVTLTEVFWRICSPYLT